MIAAIKRAYQKYVTVRRTNDVLTQQIGRHCSYIKLWCRTAGVGVADLGDGPLTTAWAHVALDRLLERAMVVSGRHPYFWRDMAQPGMNTGPEQSGVVASGPSGAADAGSTPAVATSFGEWECFLDPAYYNSWCVRRKTEREFGEGFHLPNGNEAQALAAMLNAGNAIRTPPTSATPTPG